MVIYDNYTTESGVERVKAHSNQNMMIERDGGMYSEADDFVYQKRKYTETDVPIEDSEEQTDAEQKAAAFDYITGRSQTDEQVS